MADHTVATNILNQLGGSQFLVMTGCKNLVADGNSLSMRLPRNASKANRLTITLMSNDTYSVEFSRETMPRYDKKTYEFIDGTYEVKLYHEGVYADSLQGLFERATGFYVKLFPTA